MLPGGGFAPYGVDMFPGGVPGSGLPSPAAYANSHASQFSNFNGQLQLQPGNLGGMSKSPGLDGSNPTGLDAPSSMASAYSDFSSQSPFFSQYPAQYGLNMSQYTGAYPGTTSNPFGAGTATSSPVGQTTSTPIPPLTRDSQSPAAQATSPTSQLAVPGTNPANTAGPVGTITTNPPVSSAAPSVSFGESNPYALYSSYNFGSYPTNIQAKSEPLA